MRRSILIISLVVIIPSVFISIHVIRETSFESQTIQYVTDIEHSSICDNAQIINVKRDYSAKEQTLTLSFVGQQLTSEQVEYMQKRLLDFDLDKTKLVLRQTGGTIDLNTQSEMVQQILARKEQQLASRDSTIDVLNDKIATLESKSGSVQSEQLAHEVKVLFPDVVTFAMAQTEETNVQTQKTHTLPMVNVTWKVNSESQYAHFEEWLKARLATQQIKVVNQTKK